MHSWRSTRRSNSSPSICAGVTSVSYLSRRFLWSLIVNSPCRVGRQLPMVQMILERISGVMRTVDNDNTEKAWWKPQIIRGKSDCPWTVYCCGVYRADESRNQIRWTQSQSQQELLTVVNPSNGAYFYFLFFDVWICCCNYISKHTCTCVNLT